MPYLGQGSCLIENTRFFALRLYKVERQSSTNIYKSIRTCTITSFGQFDEWCKIYVSLPTERKNVNKACFFLSIIFVCNLSCKKRIENPAWPMSTLLASQSVLH